MKTSGRNHQSRFITPPNSDSLVDIQGSIWRLITYTLGVGSTPKSLHSVKYHIASRDRDPSEFQRPINRFCFVVRLLFAIFAMFLLLFYFECQITFRKHSPNENVLISGFCVVCWLVNKSWTWSQILSVAHSFRSVSGTTRYLWQLKLLHLTTNSSNPEAVKSREHWIADVIKLHHFFFLSFCSNITKKVVNLVSDSCVGH